MTYSGQFLKLTWGFTVDGTDEIADTSLNYTTAPGWTGAAAALAELTTDYEEPLGLMATMLTSLGWADYSTLRSLKIAAIGTDGNYLVDPAVYETATPVDGDQANIPAQSTLVLSLRTGFTIGGGNYGRMYLPHTCPALEANTPYIAASSMTTIAGYMKTFVNGVTSWVNDQTTAVLFPAIMSNVGAGTGKGVTQVGAGRVVDTQRRRRNKLDDTATLVTLA